MASVCIIVPVYKVERYLRRCVDSILHQTFSDFELILVDDGSPDNCGAMCDEYARQDGRVTVIHQSNGGLSAARNAGLDWLYAHSISQWIIFVDSDDWLQPQALEALWQGANAQAVKICIGSFFYTRGETAEICQEQLRSELWTPAALLREREVLATVAWGKLYARACFEHIRYPVGKVHEDEFVTYRLLFDCDRVAVVEAPLYAYFVNESGITRSAWTPRRLDIFEALDQQLAFFQEMEDRELILIGLRRYLENTKQQHKQLKANAGENQYIQEEKLLLEKLRKLIAEIYRQGELNFWWEYEYLQMFYPMRTRLWRIFLAIKKRLGMKVDE